MSQKVDPKTVRVRIAPSPTGFAHVGTGYTALFNYAFARKNNGTFVVRIEDTDIKRNMEGAEKAIFEGLTWLGLTWDESADKGGEFAPYRQSEKLSIYQQKARELVDLGLAYEDEGAIRFKNPGNDVSWEDLVRGKVTFPGGEITDFVILKSDGYPTYNFAVVVDDIYMQISHVIRGEEHISNTPRQLALYKAFEVSPPQFAHHVTLRGVDRKKLSKRRDPVNLSIYKDQGYLPEALVNFLCNLGWSHPEGKEIFPLSEFVELFDIKRFRKAGPVFDLNKLDWINGEYIRKLSDESLKSKFKDQSLKFASLPEAKQLEITKIVKDRIKKLSDLDALAGFFFEKREVDQSLFTHDYKKHLDTAFEILNKIKNWEKGEVDKTMLGAVKSNNYKTGDFFMDLRIAITGAKFTPPINDSLIILGKKETLARIKIHL